MSKIGMVVAIAGGAAVVAGGAGYLVGKAHAGKELKKVTNERDQYKAALDQKKQAIDKPAESGDKEEEHHHRVHQHNPPLDEVAAKARLKRHIKGAQTRINADPDLTRHADARTRAARLKAYSEQFAKGIDDTELPPPEDPPVIDETPCECTQEEYEDNWSVNSHGFDYWYYCDDQTLVDQYKGEVVLDPDKLLGDVIWTKLTGCVSSDDIPGKCIYVHDPVQETYTEIDLIDSAFADEADITK